MPLSLKRFMGGAAGGAGPVELTAWNYYYEGFGVFPTSPSTTVTLTINRNGSMTCAGTGGNENVTSTEPNPSVDWYKPEGTTVGDAYEVRITMLSGTFATGTTGSWLALTSNRTWTKSFSSIGLQLIEFTIEIRLAGGAVVASKNCSITQTGDYV